MYFCNVLIKSNLFDTKLIIFKYSCIFFQVGVFHLIWNVDALCDTLFVKRYQVVSELRETRIEITLAWHSFRKKTNIHQVLYYTYTDC